MELSAKELRKIFIRKGMDGLYHSNSVLTSCTFIQKGALISRGMMEKLKLPQTSQMSDAIDKKYGIWNDVFVDSCDYHKRIRQRNVYGSVMFKIDLDILKNEDNGNLWITKLNPTKWDGVDYSDRWFSSLEDVDENFTRGTFDYMIVFRHSGGFLNIKKYIEEIIIDDVELVKSSSPKLNLTTMGFGALVLAKSLSNLNISISARSCSPTCICDREYKRDRATADKMFYPKII